MNIHLKKSGRLLKQILVCISAIIIIIIIIIIIVVVVVVVVVASASLCIIYKL